ncbi:alkaline phosphatase PhoX [Streptomyces sp. NPDC005963]|uniref:PhoX family protein n=1 Tax=Streptomyces sp. NPDC005963 TaxID=3156721 RepID=UPI003402A06A
MGQHMDLPGDSSPRPSTDQPTEASRRTVLVSGALVAAGLVAASAPGASAASGLLARADGTAGLPTFAAVPADGTDALVVPDGFRAETLARWGDPLTPSAPGWRPGRVATADEQEFQIGSHHHGVQFLPFDHGNGPRPHGLLVLAHESVDAALTEGAARTAMAAQGVTVVAVAAAKAADGGWRTVDSRYNRRITARTPVRFTGPAAGKGASSGVLAPSAVSVTPWGTVLVAEENANAFFGTDDPSWRRTESHVRYRLSAGGFGHAWHREDPRFDLADRRARPEHFGWIVEIDARDPASEPVKRTALGRFAHGSVTVSEADGRVVIHTTDAEDGEYLYKFIGSAPWRELRARGKDPLDHGTLHVARTSGDGTGRWLPLAHGQGPLTVENGWKDQADVLVRARLAADALGATPLARPERVAVSRNADVYLALAGGTGGAGCGGGTAECGPGAGPYGSIIRWRGEGGDATAVTFRWEHFLAGGDPEAPADGAFAHPKGVWCDSAGRLWISTGIPGHSLNGPEGPFPRLGNNALLVADPETGMVRRFLTAPRGAEVAGVTATADGRTMFVNIQHPGQRTAAWGAPGKDATGKVSTWPEHDRGSYPRSATVVIHPVRARTR